MIYINLKFQLPPKPRQSATSQAAAEAAIDITEPDTAESAVWAPADTSQSDHGYALSHDRVKDRFFQAQDRVTQLEKELRNAKDRERRSKKTLRSVMTELKEVNLMNEDLQQKLDLYSGTLYLICHSIMLFSGCTVLPIKSFIL